MMRKRIVQAGKCYHLVSRVAHKAFFFDDEEKDRFVDLLMRVEFSCCVKVLAYCCMSNHIHVFIFLEFGMFGSGKGKKAEREKEMQKAPSELAEKYPMPPKYELALEEGNGETAKRLLALLEQERAGGGAGGLKSALAFGIVPESADEAGVHRADIAAEAQVAVAALQDLAQGTRGFGVSRSLAYK